MVKGQMQFQNKSPHHSRDGLILKKNSLTIVTACSLRATSGLEWMTSKGEVSGFLEWGTVKADPSHTALSWLISISSTTSLPAL